MDTPERQESETAETPGTLMGGFEQFHPPSDAQWASAYKNGHIALDTNALLDLYKFSPSARQEYLDVLTQVKARLFVPYQVALEFHRNRISTVRKHVAELDKNYEEVRRLAKQFGDAVNKIGKRNLGAAELKGAQESIRVVESLAKSVIENYSPIPREMGLGKDSVLDQLIDLLDGHVGEAPTADLAAADLEEGRRRFKEKIPPGFADSEKDHGVNGDYMLWAEVKRACIADPRPVLLVTNDVTKGDWIFESGEVTVGAHFQLVEELFAATGQQLLISTVPDFLRNAKRYLDSTSVSTATLEEASELQSVVQPTIRSQNRIAREYTGAWPAAKHLGIQFEHFSSLIERYVDDPPYDGVTFGDLVKVVIADELERSGVGQNSITALLDVFPADIAEAMSWVVLVDRNGQVRLVTDGSDELTNVTTHANRLIRVGGIINRLAEFWKSTTRAINLTWLPDE